MMKYCLYCKYQKQETEFTKDHVMPKSFGNFLDAFTLVDVVCKECNSFFGNGIENTLARDSIFGILQRTIKLNNNKFKHHKKKLSDFYVIENDQPLFIDIVDVKKTNDPYNPEIFIKTANQVIVNNSTRGIERYYRIENLPTRRRLENLGLKPEDGYMRFYCQYDIFTDKNLSQKIIDILKRNDIGINFQKYHFKETTFPQLRNKINFVGNINLDVCRAVSKIAFNYFAYHYSARTSTNDNFNEIRDFIRYGKIPSYNIVDIKEKNIFDYENYNKSSTNQIFDYTHIVKIITNKFPKIIAEVSLFNELIFEIVITNNYIICLEPRSSIFNLTSKKIETLSRVKTIDIRHHNK